jgi:hypothetical protein
MTLRAKAPFAELPVNPGINAGVEEMLMHQPPGSTALIMITVTLGDES